VSEIGGPILFIDYVKLFQKAVYLYLGYPRTVKRHF